MSAEDEGSPVRVRYSTIVNYIGQLSWLALSVVFTVIVTRRLSVEDYGLFTTVMAVFNIVMLAYTIWVFWVPRFYARGVYSTVSTALTLCLIYGPIGAAIMCIVGAGYNMVLGYGATAFAIAGILVIVEGVNKFLRGIAVGSRPYVIGWVLVIRGVLRVALAYLLVATLYYGLTGALLAIVGAAAVAAAAYYMLLRASGVEIPPPKTSWGELARLARNSYIPAVMAAYTMLTFVERPIVTIATASTVAAAYLGVSYIPKSIAMRSAQAFSSSLTAKLLRKPNRADVEDVLRLTFIMLVGTSIIMLSLATPILSMFRRSYVSAWPLFTLFLGEAVLISIANVMASIAMASERMDLYSSGKSLTRTPLFKVPLARLLRNIVSIVVATTIMYCLVSRGVGDPVLIAVPYPATWLATAIPLLYYNTREARRKIAFRIPWRELASSIAGGAAASIYIYATGISHAIINSVWTDGPALLSGIIVALAIYFAVAYALSPWLRGFVKKAIEHVHPKAGLGVLRPGA